MKIFLDYVMFHELIDQGGLPLLKNFLMAARDWKYNRDFPYAKPLPVEVRSEIVEWLQKLERPDEDGSIYRDAAAFAKLLRHRFPEFSNAWYQTLVEEKK